MKTKKKIWEEKKTREQSDDEGAKGEAEEEATKRAETASAEADSARLSPRAAVCSEAPSAAARFGCGRVDC